MFTKSRKLQNFLFLFIILLIPLLFTACSSFSVPAEYKFPTPVLQNLADPFILTASDGNYYMYGTGTNHATGGGFRSWSSTDLENWTAEGLAFTFQRGNWGLRDFWAPEVLEHNGSYYMFYTARNREGTLLIGIAKADHPTGPFIDEYNEPLIDLGYAVIDPSPFVDDDGRVYLYYSRDISENYVGNGINRSDIYVLELDTITLKPISEPIFLFSPSQDWEMLPIQENWYWNEGPTVIKVADTYYMTYSGNPYYSFEYAIGVATSSSPIGTFTKNENNPMLQGSTTQNISGPGHNNIFKSHDGSKTYIVYHTHINPEVGGGEREVRISQVEFVDGYMNLITR